MSILATRTSSGSAARWKPSGVSEHSPLHAPTSRSTVMARVTALSCGASISRDSMATGLPRSHFCNARNTTCAKNIKYSTESLIKQIYMTVTQGTCMLLYTYHNVQTQFF